VRRLVACALVQALVVSTAAGASLHVHEYLAHDHPEHHHGPASHEHHQAAIADDDHHDETEDDGPPALQADSCDPGKHAVAVTMGCAQVPQLHVAIVELPSPTVVVPAAPVQSVAPVSDVRVHGPPFDSRIPARAPPLTPQA
jgi:DNA-binding transcriptional LysR family regulator